MTTNIFLLVAFVQKMKKQRFVFTFALSLSISGNMAAIAQLIREARNDP